jgi:hypothetical protein
MKPCRLFFAGTIGLLGLLGLLGIWVVGFVQAAEPDRKPYVGSEAFEQMKPLVGSWETAVDKGQGPMKMKASYKITAGGSAIVETIFEGAPHEMVTVYYDNPKRQLSMTHYCMLHNQPRMALKSAKSNELIFDFSKDSDIDPVKDDHMHALTITFEGQDKMVQHWTRSQPGKKPEVMEIAFNRVK